MLLIRFVFKFVVQIVASLVGAKVNEKRRQQLQSELLASDLTDEELVQLGPYVQTCVEHGGFTRKVLVGAMGLIVVLLLVASVLAPEIAPLTLLFAALFGILLYLGGIRPFRKARELEDVLRRDPRWLLGPDYDGRYDKLVENVDYDPASYETYDDVTPAAPAGSGGGHAGGPTGHGGPHQQGGHGGGATGHDTTHRQGGHGGSGTAQAAGHDGQQPHRRGSDAGHGDRGEGQHGTTAGRGEGRRQPETADRGGNRREGAGGGRSGPDPGRSDRQSGRDTHGREGRGSSRGGRGGSARQPTADRHDTGGSGGTSCPDCGAGLQRGATYCPDCGRQFTE